MEDIVSTKYPKTSKNSLFGTDTHPFKSGGTVRPIPLFLPDSENIWETKSSFPRLRLDLIRWEDLSIISNKTSHFWWAKVSGHVSDRCVSLRWLFKHGQSAGCRVNLVRRVQSPTWKPERCLWVENCEARRRWKIDHRDRTNTGHSQDNRLECPGKKSTRVLGDRQRTGIQEALIGSVERPWNGRHWHQIQPPEAEVKEAGTESPLRETDRNSRLEFHQQRGLNDMPPPGMGPRIISEDVAHDGSSEMNPESFWLVALLVKLGIWSKDALIMT